MLPSHFQGGALALYAGYSYHKPLAGIAALSAYLPKADIALSVFFSSCRIFLKSQMIHAANEETEMFVGHGKQDDVVAHEWALNSFKFALHCV